MRVLTTRENNGPAESAVQPPADLFAPLPPRAPRAETGRERPAPASQVVEEAPPPRDGPSRMLPVAIVGVLLSGILGVVTIETLGERGRAAAEQQASASTSTLPTVPPPPPAPGTPETPSGGTAPSRQPDRDGIEISAVTANAGTAVSLPAAGSRDWVAPGASSDGTLVRADRAEESIEFRAANTQPGMPGPFRVSWHGGTQAEVRGDATSILGVRPTGRVEFVIRPLASPGDLVLHMAGNGVSVTVDTEDGVARRIVSAPAAVVTVALPSDTAATVTVAPAGDEDIGVATAELR